MIDVKITDGIALATMTYGKANALDVDFCDRVARTFTDLKASDARAVVLTGQGKMFCAGVDLPRMLEGGADYVRRFLPALHRLYDAVFFFPKPVVAAINGHAIAGGCVLACCADRRLMVAENAKIGVTELLVGVPFPPLAFEVMRFATVPRYFQEVIYGGAIYPAPEALERGLTEETVDGGSLVPRAMEYAQKLAALPSATFVQTKTQMREDVTARLAARGAVTEKAVTEIWTRPETLEHMREFVAKTLKK